MSPILFPLIFFYWVLESLTWVPWIPNQTKIAVKITWLPSVIYWPSVHLLLLLPVQSCDNNIFLQLFKIWIKFWSEQISTTSTLARASLAASASAAIALCSWTGNRASLLRRFKVISTIILTRTQWQWCQHHAINGNIDLHLNSLHFDAPRLRCLVQRRLKYRSSRTKREGGKRCWQEQAPAYQRICSLCRWGSRASFLSPRCFAEWSAPAAWDGFYLFFCSFFKPFTFICISQRNLMTPESLNSQNDVKLFSCTSWNDEHFQRWPHSQ